MPPLTDTVGFVTGASRGIGRQIALALAYSGGPHARHVTAQGVAVDAGGTWY
ncbi:MAG: hypothetical protein V5A62_07220 [Haloarculaceae archaeon]